VFRVSGTSWARGRLRLTIVSLPAGDHLRIAITTRSGHKAHKRTVTTRPMRYRPHTAHRRRLSITTRRPTKLVLQAFRGHRRVGGSRTLRHIPLAKQPKQKHRGSS
jgi:hypothetical protein